MIKVGTKIYNKITKSNGIIIEKYKYKGDLRFTVKWDANNFLSPGYTAPELMDNCYYKIINKKESNLPLWF